MAKLRIIQTTPSDGTLDTETVNFTEDFDAPSSEWVPPGHCVINDFVVDAEWPSGFSLEGIFARGGLLV